MRLLPQALDSCSTEPLSPLVANDSPPELIFLADIRRTTRILKRIPRATHHLVATKLAGALDDVTNKNDSDFWKRLFNFAGRCFAQPQRGGQCQSRTSTVKCMLEVEADPVTPRVNGQHSCSRLFDPMKSLAKQVSTKLEDGDYRGAVRITCFEDAIADITPDTVSALLEKHPRPHPNSSLPSPPTPGNLVLFSEILEDEILSSIRSFP